MHVCKTIKKFKKKKDKESLLLKNLYCLGAFFNKFL